MRRPLLLLPAAALAALAVPTGAADDDGRSLALERGVLSDPARLPTSAARPVIDALPGELTWGDHPASVEESRLRVATRGTSFDVTVAAGGWTTLRLGSARWPRDVLVFHRRGAWWAASATALRGGDGDGGVELVDTDGDGAFDGADDLVRTGDGAFRRVADARLLWADGAVCGWDLERRGDEVALRLAPEDAPEWAEPGELGGWRALNDWRNRLGLGPQRLDRERVEACRAHHAYWARHGYSGHAEDPAHEGWSAEGHRAGRASSVWSHPDARRLVNDIAREILHRRSLLGFDGEGVGLAQGTAGSMLWGGRLTPRSPRDPILVPGRGQRLVPATIDREKPDPEGVADFYAAYRGYPVAVYFPRSSATVRDPRLTVTRHGAADPTPGVTFTEERPYHSGYREREIVFVSRDPLRHGTWYTARFRARDAEGEIDVEWSFTTGNEAFPGSK